MSETRSAATQGQGDVLGNKYKDGKRTFWCDEKVRILGGGNYMGKYIHQLFELCA